jgi:DNA-binding transcriptional regulator YhcF (GntR family)
VLDDSRATFIQIAKQIEGDILDCTLAEQSQTPSVNDLATFHRINPATVAKGIAQLVDDCVLYKRRGVGMFVAVDAQKVLIAKRRKAFRGGFVEPLLREAHKLGLRLRGADHHDRRRDGETMAAAVEATDLTKRYRGTHRRRGGDV